uniref:Uncharacterized protein n=1 Tax=Paramoeba aestuarina TaxID=180227 RepID=A0A7S4UXL3_9EUKA|mmetsp:Transcript_6495/g.9804  ORF Transcript_6495/g.9804 Transcript_6495/m.9804 type:complete len:254 (+) Transcript_6495:17-778(+)
MGEIVERTQVKKKRVTVVPRNEFYSVESPPKEKVTVEAYSKQYKKYYKATYDSTSGGQAIIQYANDTTEIVPFAFLKPLEEPQSRDDVIESTESTAHHDYSLEKSVSALPESPVCSRQVSRSPNERRLPIAKSNNDLPIPDSSDDFYRMNQVACGAFYYFTLDKASKKEGMYHLGKLIRLFEKSEANKKEIWAQLIPVEKTFRHVLHGQFMFPGVELEADTNTVEIPVTYLRSQNRIKVINKEDLHRAFVMIE